MRLRIKQRKLEFIWHLNNLGDETLAKEIMMVQRTHCLPGLVKECQDWIEELNLPDIFQTKITKKQWKKVIKDKILKQNETELKNKIVNLLRFMIFISSCGFTLRTDYCVVSCVVDGWVPC